MIFYPHFIAKQKNIIISAMVITLKNGNLINIEWDESDYDWVNYETGVLDCNARLKGIYFDGEYANGKIDLLTQNIQTIECIFDSADDAPIEDVPELKGIIVRDAGEELTIALMDDDILTMRRKASEKDELGDEDEDDIRERTPLS